MGARLSPLSDDVDCDIAPDAPKTNRELAPPETSAPPAGLWGSAADVPLAGAPASLVLPKLRHSRRCCCMLPHITVAAVRRQEDMCLKKTAEDGCNSRFVAA